jgi:CheY-like chemotaxis protein
VPDWDACSHLLLAILIVDDHDGFRAFARGMLEAAGFTVAEAATGAEAAEAARTMRSGLVLLDTRLPDTDGFEVARRLAAPRPHWSHQHHDLPVRARQDANETRVRVRSNALEVQFHDVRNAARLS